MFTGLVQAKGRVAGVEARGGGVRLLVEPLAWDHIPSPGDSVCVSGCCLTLVERAETGCLAFDVIPETLSKTTLGEIRVGDGVNLEHACRADTLMGGHFVQGHVDDVGEVLAVETRGGEHLVRVRVPDALAAYLVPKGSVCVDGVSLTIAHTSPTDSCFEVALIPETLARTTLGGLAAGARVNIECDQLVKAVVHSLRLFMDANPGGGPGR